MQPTSDILPSAHELGHGGHFSLCHQNQNILNVDCSTYFVEAPSTTNELIMAHYLLEKAKAMVDTLEPEMFTEKSIISTSNSNSSNFESGYSIVKLFSINHFIGIVSNTITTFN